MAKLEFDLGQKWAKGLRIAFESPEESNVNFKNALTLKQVHGKNIAAWSLAPRDYSAIEADGFIAGSNFKGSKQKLCIRTADCCPLFFIDRENEKLAAIHAGWRGLQLGIHLLPFSKGLDPKTTWIWCGPCLNGTSFTVSADMWTQFTPEVQKNFFVEQIDSVRAEPNKKFFLVWKYLERTFKERGVELFYNLEIDTFTSSDFASYRRWKNSRPTQSLTHNISWCGFV